MACLWSYAWSFQESERTSEDTDKGKIKESKALKCAERKRNNNHLFLPIGNREGCLIAISFPIGFILNLGETNMGKKKKKSKKR